MNNTTYRLITLFLVTIVCFWVFSVMIHDVLYPIVNLKFMAYVLNGDGLNESLRITDKNVVKGLFYTTLFYEILMTVVLLLAVILMLKNFRKAKLGYAANVASLGLVMVLFKYFVLFVTVSAEWFYMWKTSENSQIKGILFSNFALLGLIFLSLDRKVE